MSTIAIITARGGSKRIPNKNIKDFCGHPMLYYAIKAAKDSGVFDEIMVSTDSKSIRDIAISNGASVPFMRSEATSDDYATTYDVLREVIEQYEKMGSTFDYLCCIYPCVPLLNATTLKEAYDKMLTANADAIQPVCKYPSPIEWAMEIRDGILIPRNREMQLIRSQDLTPTYYDAGMFYFCSPCAMLREQSVVPSNTLAFVMDESQCQDIDTMADWIIAEQKYKLQKGTNQ